ncbi:phage head-tail connector protein [Novosphingobium bradum]|uniref:Phage head-tail connector protein n=1 Tax=Novosphingobium bradum TaxID=1737444 RepID=A0ABV7IRC3_9SPHN
MKRAIVAAATLAPVALAELKDWLGITTSSEDASLTALLRGALETCEAFTGTMPLTADCEEVLCVCADWQAIQARPVIAITGVAGIDHAGARTTLAPSAYAIEFRADGSGWVRVLDPGLAERVAVAFTAGLAPAWGALPDGLRHGIVRLAAHHYRQREAGEAGSVPPAAVAALWRPWRGLRLL